MSCAEAGGRAGGGPALSCDAACAQAANTRRFADAFGVDTAAERGEHGAEAGSERAAADAPYSPLLLRIADEHPEFAAETEARLAFAAACDSRGVVALEAAPPFLRAAQHELASRHYLLDTRGAGKEPDRYVVVTRRAGVSRPPSESLWQAAARAREEARALANDRSRRCIAVSAAADGRGDSDGVQAEAAAAAHPWAWALRSHAGKYRVVKRTRDGNDILEFGTPERCAAALSTLKMYARRGIRATRLSDIRAAGLLSSTEQEEEEGKE